MTLKAFGAFVLVADPPQDARVGALYVPEDSQPPTRGVLVDGGDCDWLHPGMMIHYRPGVAIEINGVKAVHQDYIVAYEDD